MKVHAELSALETFEVRRRRLPDPAPVRGRHVDRRTRPSQDSDAEEGSESDLRDGLGFGKTDTGDAHHPGPVEEAIVAVTRKVCDKGASTIQHVGSKTGRIDTPGKLQVIRKVEPEDKSREVLSMGQICN